MKIFSFGFRYPAHDFPPGTLIFDARELPDPASFPPLRHLNGLSPVIQGMVLALPGIQNWIDDIVAKPPKVAIAIGCFGGVHRSVSLAEELGRRFNVTPTHLDIKRR